MTDTSPAPIMFRLDAVLATLRPQAGMVVADIGCGKGVVARELARRGADVTGIDPLMPESDWETIGDGRFRLLQASAERIPLTARSVDVVIFIFSLHHMPDCQQVLREVRRILKPAGMLYVAEPASHGDNHDLIALFDDETDVLAAAQAALDTTAQPLFAKRETSLFVERRHYPDFSAFSSRMISNLRFSDYSSDDVLAPKVVAKFTELSARNGGNFDQPVNVDVFSG